MITWILTAIHTYLLHSEHGNGYQWWSAGPGPGLGQLSLVAVAYAFLRKHNCYEHGCWRIGKLQGNDGHIRCKRHHRIDHPGYGR